MKATEQERAAHILGAIEKIEIYIKGLSEKKFLL